MPVKLAVDGIAKRFDGERGALQVLDDISLQVAEGETLAIVGPSGCGKSTLMAILAGFLAPDRGTVRVDGQALTGPGPGGVLMSQQGSVFPWLTVRENLMFGLVGRDAGEQQAIADHYAELVGLKGFEHSYAHELSGGMLKRVELARALAVKPAILYMDEPFSALDALLSLRMRTELLRILAEERHTVVLITHDVEEAIHLADRVVVLSGRPTRVQATFEVGIAHPRHLAGVEVQSLRARILRELGVERETI